MTKPAPTSPELEDVLAEIRAIDARLAPLQEEFHRLSEILVERRDALKKEAKLLWREAMDDAGWVSCCRCYPGLVSKDGVCACCGFDHHEGSRIPESNPLCL